MTTGKSFEEPLELPVVAGLEELSDEGDDGVEGDVFSLGAGGVDNSFVRGTS